MITLSNVKNAALKLKRAEANGGVDPMSGFTADEIRAWLKDVSEGQNPYSLDFDVTPLAEAGARARLRTS